MKQFAIHSQQRKPEKISQYPDFFTWNDTFYSHCLTWRTFMEQILSSSNLWFHILLSMLCWSFVNRRPGKRQRDHGLDPDSRCFTVIFVTQTPRVFPWLAELNLRTSCWNLPGNVEGAAKMWFLEKFCPGFSSSFVVFCWGYSGAVLGWYVCLLGNCSVCVTTNWQKWFESLGS